MDRSAPCGGRISPQKAHDTNWAHDRPPQSSTLTIKKKSAEQQNLSQIVLSDRLLVSSHVRHRQVVEIGGMAGGRRGTPRAAGRLRGLPLPGDDRAVHPDRNQQTTVIHGTPYARPRGLICCDRAQLSAAAKETDEVRETGPKMCWTDGIDATAIQLGEQSRYSHTRASRALPEVDLPSFVVGDGLLQAVAGQPIEHELPLDALALCTIRVF